MVGELESLYLSQQNTAEIQKSNQIIAQLIADHDELIANIREDPNIIKRLAPVTIGVETNEPNFPAIEFPSRNLQLAKEILDEPERFSVAQKDCRWLKRSARPKMRLALFIAGGGLIFVSFACFSKRDPPEISQEF